MTRILITNDDGIDAAGLAPLARRFRRAGLDPVIAAPASQSSGSSASIMAAQSDGRIRVERRELADAAGVPAHAVHAGPGLIALIAARGAFGEPPDVVLSGINHGANVGRAIVHSGTVGAALTGGLHGARAIAVSLDVGFAPETFWWESAVEVVDQLLPYLMDEPAGTILNVNVPNTELPRGIVEAELAPFGIVQTTLAERDEHHISLAVEDLPNRPEPGTDAALLADGWATVTSIASVSGMPLSRALA
jgi:5'-nucleotidase